MHTIRCNVTTLALALALGCAHAPSFAAPSAPAEAPRPVATADDLSSDAKLALFEAQQQMEKGDNGKAVEILGEYVRKHASKDDSFLMRYHYASALVQVDRREEALAEYEQVVKLEPRYDAGWLGLGETAYGLGRYERAAEALKKGFEASAEKRPDVLYYAAAAQLLAGDAEGAIPVLEDLVSGTHGEPKFEWYRGLVSACLQAGDPASGRTAVDEMLARFGTNADAWYLAFQFAASNSDYQLAAEALTVVGYLRPLTRQEQMQLGDLYAAVEAPAAAVNHYTAATQDTASAAELERVASAYLASYQSDQALQVLEQAIAKEPTFRLWSLLGDLHVMNDRYPEAAAAFEECTRLSPDEPRPYLMLGYCLIEQGRPNDAIVPLARAAESEEFAERAQLLIRRCQQLARSAP